MGILMSKKFRTWYLYYFTILLLTSLFSYWYHRDSVSLKSILLIFIAMQFPVLIGIIFPMKGSNNVKKFFYYFLFYAILFLVFVFIKTKTFVVDIQMLSWLILCCIGVILAGVSTVSSFNNNSMH